MANKPIPELPEIDLEDLTDSQLFILETAIETHKLRMETLRAFLLVSRTPVEVTFDGEETGDKVVDVSAVTVDATRQQWILRKPSGEQMTGPPLEITDDATITIKCGDFPLDAGTYTLLGV